jgi:hypothetical protein
MKLQLDSTYLLRLNSKGDSVEIVSSFADRVCPACHEKLIFSMHVSSSQKHDIRFFIVASSHRTAPQNFARIIDFEQPEVSLSIFKRESCAANKVSYAASDGSFRCGI